MSKRKNQSWRNFDTEKHGQVYNLYQTIYDTVDALAAIAFIVGSALFFSESTKVAGTWLFLIGSVFFAIRPLVHLVRDLHMARLPAPGIEGAPQGS
ncbi:YrhK family protein [Henriciella aquimarina]|uniref:YrhK family protein n=1 Tax=Henriciella aquimarina TaxID=545261 RepID=UPI000A001B5F|nr:YrhK family protein [Henriciella aquimarina]